MIVQLKRESFRRWWYLFLDGPAPHSARCFFKTRELASQDAVRNGARQLLWETSKGAIRVCLDCGSRSEHFDEAGAREAAQGHTKHCENARG